MSYSAEQAYLESTVFSAEPMELVRMLYTAALTAVEKARRHLRYGEIAARSREISRVVAILVELSLAVRQDQGALGRNLVELYDYMQRRLLDANVKQEDSPLGEVSRLLATLLEGWLAASRVPEKPWEAAPLPVAANLPSEAVSRAWSL